MKREALIGLSGVFKLKPTIPFSFLYVILTRGIKGRTSMAIFQEEGLPNNFLLIGFIAGDYYLLFVFPTKLLYNIEPSMNHCWSHFTQTTAASSCDS